MKKIITAAGAVVLSGVFALTAYASSGIEADTHRLRGAVFFENIAENQNIETILSARTSRMVKFAANLDDANIEELAERLQVRRGNFENKDIDSDMLKELLLQFRENPETLQELRGFRLEQDGVEIEELRERMQSRLGQFENREIDRDMLRERLKLN